MADIPVEDLSEAEAAEELGRLAAEIASHDYRYNTEDAPIISDAAYDALRRRNLAIEQRFPHLKREDSPSNKVGAVASEKFGKVTHSIPMLSLDNAFHDSDVEDFVGRIRGQRKFAEVRELISAMEADTERARAILSTP